MSISRKDVSARLSYDSESGIFTWDKTGKVAGSLDRNGYVRIGLDNKRYQAHRVAFVIMTGEWPTQDIDHIDGDKSNNSWSNLRQVTEKINSQNIKRAYKTNKLGILGVQYRSKLNKYVADICIDGVTKYLGLYKTSEEASKAYLEAKRKYHKGCTI